MASINRIKTVTNGLVMASMTEVDSTGKLGPEDRSPKPVTLDYDAENLFDSILENLTGDIVIMGGYRSAFHMIMIASLSLSTNSFERGSILRSASPPHRRLWIPVKVGLNLRKVNLE